jgi:hypothetical protein
MRSDAENLHFEFQQHLFFIVDLTTPKKASAQP